jgi:hypothetical protein
MTLDSSDLLIKAIITLTFVMVIVIFVLIIAIISRVLKGKKADDPQEVKPIIKKVLTTGEQQNIFFQYTIHIILLSILSVFLVLAFFAFESDISFIDTWPFLFFVIVMISYCLLLVERVKKSSKRTIQRDMREF